MKKHVSKNGNLVDCEAEQGNCPLEHFSSEEEFEKHYSNIYGSSTFLQPRLITLDPPIQKLVQGLSEVGKPLIVGGSVRDALNGVDSSDVDLEVHETSLSEISRKLRSSGYRVNEVGKQFGVLKVWVNGSEVDVSVPRRENKTGKGHRAFSVDTSPLSMEEAVERRDFTINAVMYDPIEDEVIDLVGGVDDLNNKVLRHVSGKFSEDPLRVLRGFQFASRFDLEGAPETLKVSRSILGEYGDLARERVQIEWDKFYKGNYPDSGLRFLKDSGWDESIPGLSEAVRREFSFSGDNNPIAIGAAIAFGMEDRYRKGFLSTTIVGVKNQSRVEELARAIGEDLSTPSSRRYAANRFSFKELHEVGEILGNEKVVEWSDAAKRDGVWEAPESLWITGKDVLGVSSSSRRPGPWVGEVLKDFQEKQYSRKFSSREQALRELESFLR